MTTPERSTLVRRILVEGVVQGVGYREFTRRAALRLNVSGWVRNRSDGAVEALVRGPPASVEALIAEMRQGPRFAAVERLNVIKHDETPSDDGGTFVVRSTA
ncbi:MAG: acylphosphatase [Roseiarcus sp.]|uniref:acylphosphatase n=1 Tax=Roseiarcus sp. TaxID=1969460 RepID=UPI003C39B1F4